MVWGLRVVALFAAFVPTLHAAPAAAEPDPPMTATERWAEMKRNGAATYETQVDDDSMEYATAAEYFARLPLRDDLSMITGEGDADPGTVGYTDNPDPYWIPPLRQPAVRSGTRTSWGLYGPPHPAAPAVIRVHDAAVTAEDGTTLVTTRIGMLCEGEAAACADLKDMRDSMVPELRLLKEEQAY